MYLPEVGFDRKKNIPPVSLVGSDQRPIGIGNWVAFQKSAGRNGIRFIR